MAFKKNIVKLADGHYGVRVAKVCENTGAVSLKEINGLYGKTESGIKWALKAYDTIIDKYVKKGMTSSFINFIHSPHDREYESLTRKEIKLWKQHGLFGY